MPQIEIKNLPDGADQELPSGEQKMKSSRGTLAGWVIRTCFGLLLTVSAIAYKSELNENKRLRGEMEKKDVTIVLKDNKIEELNNYITNLLIQQISYLKPTKQKVEKVEDKVDSLKQSK